MIRVETTHTRADSQAYMAVISARYALTAKEQEVVDLATFISATEQDSMPALHALSVLPDPDPLFVRFLTDDVFDMVDGRIVGTLPIYQKILDTLDGWWR